MTTHRALIASALTLCAAAAGPSPSAANDDNLATLDEIHTLVAEHFVDADLAGVDWQRARAERLDAARAAADGGELQMVVNGMLDELQMSHTRMYTAQEPAYYQLLDIFRDYLDDEIDRHFGGEVSYVGIGLFTELVDGVHHVTGIVDGAPASRSELLTGDALVLADGHPFHPLDSFLGKEGATVALEIRRRATGDLQTVSVVPERIVPHEMFRAAITASARVIDRRGTRVGYVRIWSYAGSEMQEALEEALTGPLRSAHALVLDVRGGWGGASPRYLNIFHRRVPILEMSRRDGSVHRSDSQWRKPVVLLVDGGTRSGKELLAHAFREYRIGQVVGDRTAGAVAAGKPFFLDDGSLLYLAVGSVTVDGATLEGVGVAPDVQVESDRAWSAGADRQLAEAIQVAALEAARSRQPRR